MREVECFIHVKVMKRARNLEQLTWDSFPYKGCTFSCAEATRADIATLCVELRVC